MDMDNKPLIEEEEDEIDQLTSIPAIPYLLPEDEPHESELANKYLSLYNVLLSKSNKYEVQGYYGKGGNGQVYKCSRKYGKKNVAVKVVRLQSSRLEKIEAEMAVLLRLNLENADRFNIVKTYDIFLHKNFVCYAFEPLGINLYDFCKERGPLPLKHIRPIMQQVLNALSKLLTMGIIHADLKPDNIMITNKVGGPLSIKIIDFGSSIPSVFADQHYGTHIQFRFYRAPEILLGLPFDEGIDMWSTGCIGAQLFLGAPLYPGSTNFAQMIYMCATQGLPPKSMLDRGKNTESFFRLITTRKHPYWTFRTYEEYQEETGHTFRDTRPFIFNGLVDLIEVNFPKDLEETEVAAEKADRHEFVDLLEKMLTYEREKRVHPSSALNHSFFTLKHFDRYDPCNTIQSSVHLMMQISRRNEDLRRFIEKTADCPDSSSFHE